MVPQRQFHALESEIAAAQPHFGYASHFRRGRRRGCIRHQRERENAIWIGFLREVRGPVVVGRTTIFADGEVADDLVEAQATVNYLRVDAVAIQVLDAPLGISRPRHGTGPIVPLEAEILHLVDVFERTLLVFGESRPNAVPHALIGAIDDPMQSVVAFLGARHQGFPVMRRGARPQIGRAIGHVDVIVGGDQAVNHRALLRRLLHPFHARLLLGSSHRKRMRSRRLAGWGPIG